MRQILLNTPRVLAEILLRLKRLKNCEQGSRLRKKAKENEFYSSTDFTPPLQAEDRNQFQSALTYPLQPEVLALQASYPEIP